LSLSFILTNRSNYCMHFLHQFLTFLHEKVESSGIFNQFAKALTFQKHFVCAYACLHLPNFSLFPRWKINNQFRGSIICTSTQTTLISQKKSKQGKPLRDNVTKLSLNCRYKLQRSTIEKTFFSKNNMIFVSCKFQMG